MDKESIKRSEYQTKGLAICSMPSLGATTVIAVPLATIKPNALVSYKCSTNIKTKNQLK